MVVTQGPTSTEGIPNTERLEAPIVKAIDATARNNGTDSGSVSSIPNESGERDANVGQVKGIDTPGGAAERRHDEGGDAMEVSPRRVERAASSAVGSAMDGYQERESVSDKIVCSVIAVKVARSSRLVTVASAESPVTQRPPSPIPSRPPPSSVQRPLLSHNNVDNGRGKVSNDGDHKDDGNGGRTDDNSFQRGDDNRSNDHDNDHKSNDQPNVSTCTSAGRLFAPEKSKRRDEPPGVPGGAGGIRAGPANGLSPRARGHHPTVADPSTLGLEGDGMVAISDFDVDDISDIDIGGEWGDGSDYCEASMSS